MHLSTATASVPRSGGQLANRLQTAIHTLVVWIGKLSKADASCEACCSKLVQYSLTNF